MIRIEPVAVDREVVELLEPVRRGGVLYEAGRQFAVVRRAAKSVVVLTEANEKLMLPPRLVRRVVGTGGVERN